MSQLAHGRYVLDDDPGRVDLGAVYHYLSEESYWAKGRPRESVLASVAASPRVVGAYDGDQMVGFCRVVTDGVSIAYLADVFVVEAHRGEGLGKELVRTAIEDGPYTQLRWLLHTADAHALYAKFGFDEPTEMLMERPKTG